MYFNVVICSSLIDFSILFKIVSLETSGENLTKLWISIIKKGTWRLRLAFSFLIFCAYAKFFAKEHAHWGEKIQRVNFRQSRKVKFNATFFPSKAHRLKVQTLGCWKPAFNVFKFIHWLLNVDTLLFFALSAGSVQLNR